MTGGLIVILLGVIVYVDSLNIKSMKGLLVTSAFFPQVAAALLLLLGTILMSGALYSGYAVAKKGAAKISESTINNKEGNNRSINWKPVLISIAMLAVYIALMEPVGFLITTFLYLFFQIVLLAPKSKRRYILFAVIAAATSVVIYMIFVFGLSVILPSGILSFI